MQPDKNLLEISLNNLEKEAKRNPSLMFEWGMELAKAKKKVKETKNQYRVKVAELEQKIRSNPEAYGLEKITEKALESCVLVNDDCQTYHQEMIQAEYEEDILDIFFKALNDKKGEIEVLSRLHGQLYWSKPDVLSPPKEDRAAIMAQTNKKIKK